LENTGFNRLKYILMSGEPIYPSDLTEWYRKVGDRVKLVNLWGTSETTLAKTFYLIQPEDVCRASIPVGTPLPGAAVVVLNKNLEICDHLVTGELYIKTPFRTAGYLNNVDLNQRLFVDDPFIDQENESNNSSIPQAFNEDIRLYKTGDLGRILYDGNFDISGRIDRQVKIRGARVELGDIENVLVNHPGVSEAAVIKKEIPTETQPDNAVLYAYIVPVTGHIAGTDTPKGK
ncbi:MAG: amino acid adenylation domain-containing protein, partial [bacterium]|nr:amino acid adenylation domain-containing protein [bacterium]